MNCLALQFFATSVLGALTVFCSLLWTRQTMKLYGILGVGIWLKGLTLRNLRKFEKYLLGLYLS